MAAKTWKYQFIDQTPRGLRLSRYTTPISPQEAGYWRRHGRSREIGDGGLIVDLPKLMILQYMMSLMVVWRDS